ncbi:MAG TPA: hypothetical protein PLB41_12015 [Rubrivivax sp.]|nr:hypothetical protein [Rubrivivax sp.]HPO19157.1 hypothetical protein [Rubrivivax sp.]
MKALVCALAALLCSASAHAAPPQRNLSVETRITDEQFDAQRSAQGSVTIGSRGGRVDADGSLAVHSGRMRQAGDAAQRVLVLNGARATLRLAQGMPVESTEVWWTPWGPGAVVRSQWVELVNGMEVQPLWPGGDAPVTVQLAAQSADRPAPGQTPGRTLPAQAQVLTTVQAPLGEWVEIARVQTRSGASSVATGGFGAATASRERSLQLRVSLP